MDDEQLYIEVPASTVNYVNRILEGYEYLGILTTINAKGVPVCAYDKGYPAACHRSSEEY